MPNCFYLLTDLDWITLEGGFYAHTLITTQSTAVSYLLQPYIPHNIYHISHTHTESLKVSIQKH